MEVFGATPKVHSVSFFLSLPATTMLSADAAFTVPLAFFTGIFLISVGFSTFFSAGAGVMDWAVAGPARPAVNAIAKTRASRLFTVVTPQPKGLGNSVPTSWAYDKKKQEYNTE